MSEALFSLLKLAVIVLLVQHLLGPLLVWKRQRIPATYGLYPFELQSVLTGLNEKTAAVVEELKALGFVPVAASALSGTNSLLSFLLFRRADDLSVASVTFATSPVTSFVYIEFTQAFADRTVLDVNTIPLATTFPENAQKLAYRFPSMSASELYAAFVKLRASLLPRKSPVLTLSMEEPVADLSRKLDEETAGLVARGYVAHAVDQGKHRLTMKGAFLFAWKLSWPWKQLRNRAELAEARRALDAA